MRQFPSQIFRSRQREVHKDSGSNTASLFNTGGEGGKEPFNSLIAFREVALHPGQFVKHLSGNEAHIIIPLVGALEYQCNNGVVKAIMPGEIVSISFPETLLNINNPYDKDPVIYLEASFSQKRFIERAELSIVDLDVRNKLHAFVQGLTGLKGYIGMYDGRREELYKLQSPDNGLLIFVISGAFEVSGRLLEERDALSVWDCDEIDFEALSESAVILLIEVYKTS